MKLFRGSRIRKIGSYFIELLIVVVGVSIAFQLNVWNDNRKTRQVEKELLENFRAENNYNMEESDSSAIDKNRSVESGLALIEYLKTEDPATDSVKILLAQLYEISWPSFTTTHLDNYLNFTTGSTPLREEMLNLKTRVQAIHDLSDNYIIQKQAKYFDFLATAVDMNDNLNIVDEERIFSVEFSNNLMFIIAYEQSMAEVLEQIDGAHLRLDSLILNKEN